MLSLQLWGSSEMGISMKKQITVFAVMTVLALCVLTGCENKDTTPVVQEIPTTQRETEPETTTEPVTELVTEVSREGMVRSRLTGEWIARETGTRRPVAVMFNNIIDAVPQSGIERAGVVYEAPVEGALTRLMGIIEDYESLEKIGSVRSCRLYYLYWAKEFDAVYTHFGQAVYAKPLLDSSDIDNLNGLQLDGSCFYRTSDRVAPHNAYISADGIAKGIAQYGYRTDYEEDFEAHYVFHTDETTQVELTDGQTAHKVVPGYAINKPWFEYNAGDGLYYRFQYGDIQIDELTGNHLAYKNIILQLVDYYDYGDGYLYITTTGTGKGKYITNGRAIDITWKKDTDFGVTHYYDMQGNEITLNTGKTWVCIIQDDREENIVLE